MLRKIYVAANATRMTERALASWSGEQRETSELYTGDLLKAVYKEAKAVLAVSGVVYDDAFAGTTKEQLAAALAAITASGKALSADISAWLRDVKVLAEKSFDTFYSLHQGTVTLNNLAIFAKEAPDKNVWERSREGRKETNRKPSMMNRKKCTGNQARRSEESRRTARGNGRTRITSCEASGGVRKEEQKAE